MRGLSADAAALFTSGEPFSHLMMTYCEIRRGGLVQAIPQVIGGSVTVDTGSAVRRRATVDLVPTDDLIPETESALLYPGRSHIHLWRGIDWNDDRAGTAWGATSVQPGWELWPLGVFLQTEAVLTNQGDGTRLQVGGGDLSRRIERAAWTAPYVIAAGGSVAAAWSALILNRWPDAQVSVEVGTDGTTPLIVYGDKPNADPWEDARKLGSLIGGESFVNAEGVFVLAAIPDGSPTTSVATYAQSTDGSPSGLLNVERRLDADKGYSQVVLDSNRAGGVPLRGVASDTDPTSATYIGGDYGTVPLFAASAANTQAQIDAQAAAKLRQKLAAADAITIEIVPNPALEDYDTVRVRDAGTRVDGYYQLDGWTVPLGASDAMKAAVRRVA